MRGILITESLEQRHRKFPFPLQKIISTGGNSILRWSSEGFSLSPRFLHKLSSLKPGSVVFIGTDLDVEGTILATVIKKHLDDRGIRSVRYAYTEKGYVYTGGVFPGSRLLRLSEIRTLLAEKTRKIRKETGLKISARGAYAVARLYEARGKSFPAGSGGNTYTFCKAFSPKDPSKGYETLKSLYFGGKITYPRVDYDYVKDGPFQLYPHPPLPAEVVGVKHTLGSGEEIRVEDYGSALLYLNHTRIISPAFLPGALEAVKTFYRPDLSPNPLREKELRKILAFEDELSFLVEEDNRAKYGEMLPLESYTPQELEAKLESDSGPSPELSL